VIRSWWKLNPYNQQPQQGLANFGTILERAGEVAMHAAAPFEAQDWTVLSLD
jgi:hypothetical protein